MKRRQKALSLLLTLCLLAGLLPWSALPARANAQTGTSSDNPTSIGTWTDLKSALSGGAISDTPYRRSGESAESPTYFKLTADCIDGEKNNESNIYSRGRHVVLDLNGHTIDRGLAQSAIRDGYVIRLSDGSLTVTDSSVDAEHPYGQGSITGGKLQGLGGGVYVETDAAFTLAGGRITGNTCTRGGTFSGGGGVFCEGTFTMTGGEICGNTVEGQGSGDRCRGGGVFVYNGTFTMTGGRITENHVEANGGGVYLNANGAFRLSGGAVISGNTGGNGDAADNVYLRAGKSITVAGPLAAGASVGVGLASGGGAFTTGLQGKGTAANFTSDDPGYTVADAESGEAKLERRLFSVSVTNGSADPASAGISDPVTVTANEPAAGMRFKEWSGADDLTFDRLSATASFTMPAHAVELTATYEEIPVYRLSVDALAFDNAYGDATWPEAMPLVIRNTGNRDVTIISVKLGDSAFILDENGTGSTTVAVGETDDTTYTVRLREPLNPNFYYTTATVTYNSPGQGEKTATADVSFTYYGVRGMFYPSSAAGWPLYPHTLLPLGTKALLLAAGYDGDGRMSDLEAIPIRGGLFETETTFLCRDGYTYKLTLVDADTFAPLCEAWSETAKDDRK